MGSATRSFDVLCVTPRSEEPKMVKIGASCSVTVWIEGLKAGDPEAAEKLWRRYFEALVRVARGRLRGASRAVADEEDAALNAFDSFCRGAARGRYPAVDG